MICHGLDLSTSTLSSEYSTWTLSDSTNTVLQNLVSSTLLHLAIAIRTNLYQNKIKGSDIILENSASLYYDAMLVEHPASLKQVCDKIIHANTFSKFKLPKDFKIGADKIGTQIRGTEQNQKAWTMNLVLDLLAEDILAILDEIENKHLTLHATSA